MKQFAVVADLDTAVVLEAAHVDAGLGDNVQVRADV